MKVNLSDVKGMEGVAEEMASLEADIQECFYNGEDKIIAFTPIDMADWSLGLILSKSDITEPIGKMRNIIILSGLIILGIISLIIYFTVQRIIARPINRAVKNLSEGAAQVSSASIQIETSSQLLAEGSSAQASSLEETSSSLEEMASMTKQNAQNAGEADNLMKGANQVVNKANESMGELNAAMDDISRSSEESSKIIKTIDEIAFQTNLLALNAAVEAARAGEAGAGFAIVADEVRNLALRAAEAAKNTSDLIEENVKRIGNGSELVKKTSEEFTEVTNNAAKVGELVAEIAAASNEQAQGIEQLNSAVADMDKIVQQNAANAEESASASEEMNSQADKLNGVVKTMVRLVGESGGSGVDKLTHVRDQSVSDGDMRAVEQQTAVISKRKPRSQAVEIGPEKVIQDDEDDFQDF
jgi:methyl-accepting chemotaxis protein